MYYIVSLPEKNGLEFLSPYIFLERSGDKHGYVEYSPREYLSHGFSSYEMAFIEAFEIYDTISEYDATKHIEFAQGIYVLDFENDTLSQDLTPYFRRGLEKIEDPYSLKGDIKLNVEK